VAGLPAGYDPREFIRSVEWRFATTMAHSNPHWYVVQRDEGGPLFDGFLAYLEAVGSVRTYKGHPYRYVTVDDHDYWTTCASGAGTIVNRKPSSEAGWDPEPAEG
jgi:hypothetical protein